MRKNHEFISIRVAPEQKKHLVQQAELQQKSLSHFMIEAAFFTHRTGGATEGEISIFELKTKMNEVFAMQKEQQKTEYIIVRLLLKIGAEQLKSTDAIMKYFRECQMDAEEKFGEE